MEERMVFITLHPFLLLVSPRDVSFIHTRNNIVAEPETQEAFLHNVNQIQQGQRNSDDVTIPYCYNGWDDEPSGCNSFPHVINISSDEDCDPDEILGDDNDNEQNERA